MCAGVGGAWSSQIKLLVSSPPSRGREDSVLTIQFILSFSSKPASCTGSQGKRHSKVHFGFLYSDSYHVSRFPSWLSFSIAAGFEQLSHSSMKRGRNFEGASPWCLLMLASVPGAWIGRMLIIWKSTVELFLLVSEPAFKGMIDREKLMLKVFLKRASYLQAGVGPARCQQSCALACLTLQWRVSGKVLVQQEALRAFCIIRCYP